jgi:hypothetical protein
VGNAVIGPCSIVWQQRQRPDKSGKSDRSHRPAKGVYMWWAHCNKLVLTYLDDGDGGGEVAGGLKLPPIPGAQPTAAPATALPPAAIPGPTAGDKKAPTPPKGTRPGTKVAPGSVSAAPDPTAAAKVADGGGQELLPPPLGIPSKGWLLPMGISSSCQSENGKMLAFGLTDGSTIVWDDHFGTWLGMHAFVRDATHAAT